MRTLHLFRHAKSEWSDAGLDDYDRPLAARGRAAAPKMGLRMAAAGVRPDAVVCSTAARAQQTALLAFEAGAWPREILYRKALYLAEMETLSAFVRALDDRWASVMLIGHNPGMADLAQALAGDGADDLRARIAVKFPTAAFATIVFGAASWRDATAGGGRLEAFETPRNAQEHEAFRD